MLHDTTVFVTGGAGFIGSHLIDVLLDMRCRIICIDNFDSFYSRAIKESNISHNRTSDRFTFIEGDIRDTQLLQTVFHDHKIEYVIHLAAKAGVRPSILNKAEYIDVNVNGTLNLLETMRIFNVTKLIYASSSSVYGNNVKVPYSEYDNVDRPISPYAASKKAGELFTHTFHYLYKFDVINLRFFTVYGPRQRPDLAIHKFFKSIYSNTPIEVYGDGSSSRDYTFIDDIVTGIINSLFYISKNVGVYETINLGNSNPITLLNLLNAIEDIAHLKFNIHHLPVQEGDVNYTCADISKAKRIINYNPATTIAEGLIKFKHWFTTTNKLLPHEPGA